MLAINLCIQVSRIVHRHQYRCIFVSIISKSLKIYIFCLPVVFMSDDGAMMKDDWEMMITS